MIILQRLLFSQGISPLFNTIEWFLSLCYHRLMSLKIVIDGYNLIRQSDRLIDMEAISLETGRKGLVDLLAEYRMVKPASITVVFDGWESDNIGSSREKVRGVEVLYSGKGVKADDLIMKMADRERERIVVVTSDREVANHCMKKGAAVIPSHEFEMKMNMAGVGDEYGYDDEEDDEPRVGTKKKGPARKLSREERQKKRKLGKL